MDDPQLGILDLCRAINLSHTQVFRKMKTLTGDNPTIFMGMGGAFSFIPSLKNSQNPMFSFK